MTLELYYVGPQNIPYLYSDLEVGYAEGVFRAFTSGFYKKFYFIISKVTLLFIPYHFIIHPISQFLFYYSAH